MSKLSDQNYLLSKQYKTASNLDARFHLHERFSVNKYGWDRWVFDHFDLPQESRILELGCGPCYLWLQPRKWTCRPLPMVFQLQPTPIRGCHSRHGGRRSNSLRRIGPASQ